MLGDRRLGRGVWARTPYENGVTGVGARSPVGLSGTAWQRIQAQLTSPSEKARLTASDAQVNDWFGYSVAASGDVVVVGALYEDGGAGNPLADAGTAYVFERNAGGAGNWGQVAKLTASDAQANVWFSPVAASGDTVVVGARGEDGGAGGPLMNAGAAYLYCLDDDFEENDEFGTATLLGAGTYVGRHICNGDDDYYAFTHNAGDTLDVLTLFSHAAGDLDIALYDAARNLLTSSSSVTDNEAISYPITASGTYYLRVYGFLGAAITYNLQVGGPATPTPTPTASPTASPTPSATPSPTATGGVPPSVTPSPTGTNPAASVIYLPMVLR